jgi:hypothetical protein
MRESRSRDVGGRRTSWHATARDPSSR